MYEPHYTPRHAVVALVVLTGLLILTVALALLFMAVTTPLPYEDPEPPTTL